MTKRATLSRHDYKITSYEMKVQENSTTEWPILSSTRSNFLHYTIQAETASVSVKLYLHTLRHLLTICCKSEKMKCISFLGIWRIKTWLCFLVEPEQDTSELYFHSTSTLYTMYHAPSCFPSVAFLRRSAEQFLSGPDHSAHIWYSRTCRAHQGQAWKSTNFQGFLRESNQWPEEYFLTK